MTINKSQKQFLRYVDIDVQTRECFTHEQFYIIDIKVTKKCNFYIITLESKFINTFKMIRNIQ